MTNQVGKDGLYIKAPARTFGQSIVVCLENYFQFSGRASRSEYWFFFLFLILVNMLATMIDVSLFSYDFDDTFAPLSTVLALILFFPSISVTWRRLHDTNKSGWWSGGFMLVWLFYLMFLGVISNIASSEVALFYMGILIFGSIAYSIVIIVFLCTKGDLSENRFG